MSAVLTPNIIPRSRPTQRSIPPLENGDRLGHSEYIRRYSAMPCHVKAERIEGIVYMAAAAVSAGFHGQPHFQMATWMGVYQSMTPGIMGADNATIRLDVDNDPQPDLCLYILPTHGGRVKIDEGHYIIGAPELVVEIAASSVSFDLGVKLHAYRRNGVKEYVIHRTYDGEIDWFMLREGQYIKQSPNAAGVYRSEAFPGLWLNEQAIIDGRLADVLETLRDGSGDANHAEFVKMLAGAKGNIRSPRFPP